MLTIYKPWIKNIDSFLHKEIINPKYLFSLHLCGHVYDEEFPKVIMMNILSAKIAMQFHCKEETMFGLVDEYVPTLNRNNDDMAGVEEIVCEPTDNLDVKEYMDLGEEHFYS